MPHKAKGPVKLNVRLEAHLHGLLTKSAEEHNRSLQTEIVTRLEQSFSQAVPDHVQSLIDKAAVTAVAETLRAVGWPETELGWSETESPAAGQEHDKERGASGHPASEQSGPVKKWDIRSKRGFLSRRDQRGAKKTVA